MVKVVVLLCLGLIGLLVHLQGIDCRSEPYDPIKAERAKQSYCFELKYLQRKLPSKYQKHYTYIQRSICSNKAKSIVDVTDYLKESLTKDEQVEVGIIQSGKAGYCKFILGLSKLYPVDGSEAVDAHKVKLPVFTQFKSMCRDNRKGIWSIIPLAQALAKSYYHF